MREIGIDTIFNTRVTMEGQLRLPHEDPDHKLKDSTFIARVKREVGSGAVRFWRCFSAFSLTRTQLLLTGIRRLIL
jgi:hypothetical protein